MRSSLRGVGVLFAAVLFLAACGDDGAAPAAEVRAGTYVGKVSGTDAYIALVTDGRKLTGYVCDAKTISTWLAVLDVGVTSVSLNDRRGSALGTARFAGDRASGEVTLDGASRGFTASLAADGAGLYRLASGTAGQPGYRETGWIVLADGTERGRTNFIDPTSNLVTEDAPKREGSGATKFIDPTGDL